VRNEAALSDGASIEVGLRPKARLLVVDDERVARTALAELLGECDFDVVTASGVEEALGELSEQPVDLILTDIHMGRLSGIDLLRKLRRQSGQEDVPVILMSAVDDDVGRIQGLEAGADDFLPKPLNFDELVARLRVQLRRRRRAMQLRESAIRDELCGVLNRRGLFEAVNDVMARAQLGHWPCSLLLIDVDRFKSINDSYGHLVGDQVLRAVADTLVREVRAQDGVGRIGGDEFVVVLAGASERAANQIANRLRLPIRLPAPLPVVTLSVGVEQAQARDTLESLLERADQAMYDDKSARR
jgi:two-component system cell cycle response regulator